MDKGGRLTDRRPAGENEGCLSWWFSTVAFLVAVFGKCLRVVLISEAVKTRNPNVQRPDYAFSSPLYDLETKSPQTFNFNVSYPDSVTLHTKQL